MSGVLLPTNQTCLATNQVVAGFKQLLQKVESNSTTKFVQVARFIGPRQTCFAASDVTPMYGVTPASHVSINTTCNNLICSKKGLNAGCKTRKIAFKLVFRSKAVKQIARFCFPFYHSFTNNYVRNFKQPTWIDSSD